MKSLIFWGMGLPLLGTIVGAVLAFVMPRGRDRVNRCLQGFSAGAMLAASVWSLLIPALEHGLGGAAIGFAVGMLLLLLPDGILERYGKHMNKNSLLILAIVLHNIPEGLAVGAGCAGYMMGDQISGMEAVTLAIGIALQNIPDGAVIVLPLVAGGMSRKRAFFWGVMSGVVEPIATVAMMLCAPLLIPILPVFMAFAAGAMCYVVVHELIPGMMPEQNPSSLVLFTGGFLLLLTMDVVLG